ncbi:tankyrase-1-like [Trichogramma pretiosum]|uniref:tankyrase-1-like n=1 Tax=Trichogramma pretiosum TaxID=7493 RepID=UPI000C71B8CA|nr:tankyrase-1-like [Trichogramma pretiosum]
MKQTNHEATSSQESNYVRTDAHAKSRSLNGILKTTIEHLRLCKTLEFPSREIIPGSLDERTETAVHLAARDHFSSLAMDYVIMAPQIDSLFQYYGNVNYISPVDGLSHFHVACQVGNLEMVREFVDNGVDVDLACRNLPRTPLNTTVYLDQAEGEDDRVSILELLLRKGASPNELFEDGKSPLHCLCYTFLESEGSARDDKLKMIELLLRYECDVNTTDMFCSSPIFSLFRDFTTKDADQVKLLEILLDHGADLKAVDSSGHTILHRIIRPNLPEYCEVDNYEKLFNDDIGAEVVALLLKHGIDVNVKDIMGRTPLQIGVSKRRRRFRDDPKPS